MAAFSNRFTAKWGCSEVIQSLVSERFTTPNPPARTAISGDSLPFKMMKKIRSKSKKNSSFANLLSSI